MTQPELFAAAPCDHRPLVAHGTGPFEARLRLLERLRVPFLLTTRTAAHLWGLAVPRRGPAAVPLELAVPHPPPETALPHLSAAGAPRGGALLSRQDVVSVESAVSRSGSDDPPLLQLPPEDITASGGRRLTTPERTAYDCARSLPRYEALALVDQFLARGVSLPALLARSHRATGPGTAQSRAVIAMADPAAQSPGESLVRGVLIDTGFPRPSCQLSAPPTPYRLDLGHARYRCALEYDGETHHTGRANRSHDGFRRSRLAASGWRVLPVTRDFRTAPAPYLEAWLTLLLASGWSPTPTRLSTIARRIQNLRLPLRLLRPDPRGPPRRSEQTASTAEAVHRYGASAAGATPAVPHRTATNIGQGSCRRADCRLGPDEPTAREQNLPIHLTIGR